MNLKTTIIIFIAIIASVQILFAKSGIKPEQENLIKKVTRQIVYEENKGQITDLSNNSVADVLYTSQTNGLKFFLTKKGISYVFSAGKVRAIPAIENNFNSIKTDGNSEALSLYRMDMELVGANPNPEIYPSGEKEYLKNYYLAHCQQGIIGVKSFQNLLYKNIYPNMDMLVYSVGDNMKYDFIIKPGGDIKNIKMKFKGATDLQLTTEGKIRIITPLGYIEEDAPFTFQQAESGRIEVPSKFLVNENVVSFSVDSYNKNIPLIIDPTRQWATFLGGNLAEWIFGSSIDKSNNLYLSGFTNSSNFPATTGSFQTSYAGSQDGFLAKFNASGSPIWITYYGGTGIDDGRATTVDKNNDVYFNGWTSSSNLPVTSGAFQTSSGGGQDAFLVKFNSSGVRQWATYYGGSGSEFGVELTTDSKLNVIMVGFTSSSNLSTTSGSYQTSHAGGSYDGFAIKLNSSGTRQWSTYYGGSSDDRFYAAAADTSDNIYLIGNSVSSNFPVSSGSYQSSLGGSYDLIFVKLNSNGARLWATYYGGTGEETSFGATIDDKNNLLMTGLTKSSNFPVSNGSFQSSYGGGSSDGVVVKMSPSGARLWATYFGGSAQDDGYRITTDWTGTIYVCGYTQSINFPASSDAFQSTYGGGARDGFLIIFNSGGSRQYATYYGGKDDDYCAGIAVDALYNIYLSGSSYSSNLSVTSGAYQTSLGGVNDAIIVKFLPDNPVISASGPLTFCDGETVFLSTVNTYNSYKWSHGPTTRSVTIRNSGKYVVSVTDGNNVTSTSDTVNVTVLPVPKANFTFINSCQGQQISFKDSSFISIGTLSYNWHLGDGRTSTLKDVSVAYANPGSYNVKLVVTSNNGCKDSITKPVTVFANPKADFNVNNLACLGENINFSNTSIIPGNTNVTYFWDFGNGNTSSSVSPVHSYQSTGSYNIKLVLITQFGCKDSITKTVMINTNPVANFGFNNMCTGREVVFTDSSTIAQGTITYAWNFGNGGNSTTKNPVYIFNNPGNYDVTLVVTSDAGCKDSVTKTITIFPLPTKPVITANGPAAFCEGDSVSLNAGTGYSSYLWTTGDTTENIIVKQSGNYSVKVSNANGCTDSSASFSITAHSIDFSLSFTENQRILSTAPFSVVFTNTTPDANKYDFTWKFGDGKTSNQLSPIYSYQDSGLFNITLIAKNKITGCIDSIVKEDWILVSKSSGVNEDFDFNKIKINIYPNPTTSDFIVDIENTVSNTNIYLSLYDALGRKLDEKMLKPDDSQKNIAFQTNQYNKGIYFLKVTNRKDVSTYKVVKQ